MRRTIWLLAFGAVGMALRVNLADDAGAIQNADWALSPTAESDQPADVPAEFPAEAAAEDESPAEPAPALAAPSRKLKSYAQDLFGDMPAEPEAEPADLKAEATTDSDAAPDAENVIVPASAEASASHILQESDESTAAATDSASPAAPVVNRRLPHPTALKRAKKNDSSLEALLNDPRSAPRSVRKLDPLADAPLPWETRESLSTAEPAADKHPIDESITNDNHVAPADFAVESLVEEAQVEPGSNDVQTIAHEELEPGRLQRLPTDRTRQVDLNDGADFEVESEGGLRLRPAEHLTTGKKLSEIDTTAGTRLPVQTKSKASTQRMMAPIDTNPTGHILDAVDGNSPHPSRPPIGKPRNARAVSAPTPETRLDVQPKTRTKTAVSSFAADAEAAPVNEQTSHHAKPAPSVSVEWANRGGINVGQECECDLIVRNTGEAMAKGIEVEANFPGTVRVLSSEPAAKEAGAQMTWHFESLDAGEKKTVRVRFIPTQRGQLNAEAQVRFTGQASGTFEVSEPLLAVRLEGPAEVMKNESAAHTVVISNPGTGLATNVKIEALIPAGLEHPTHSNKLNMDLGSLNPGETRTVRLGLSAVTGGDQIIQLKATADAGLEQTADHQVHVTAPSLSTKIEGPGLRYLGRQGIYNLSVVNDGQAATDNVRVMHKIPEGFEYVSADRGVQYDATNRLLSWYVGHLEPGQTTKIALTLEAERIGQFTHFVRATADLETVADSQLDSDVVGAASLVVEMKDQDDPVEVGVDAVYEIKVKNEGSAPARNVSLTCDLPKGCEFSAAAGSREYGLEGDQVTFHSIPELAPGKTATFELKLKAETAGRRRMRASVVCDSEEQPLVCDESTQFYGDQ